MGSKREKQIERAIAYTAGMYGDLQGIVGMALPSIKGLSLEMQSGCETVSELDLSISEDAEAQVANELLSS